MGGLFLSHAWAVHGAVGYGLAAKVNEVTYQHSLAWGAAHPDVSGCWSEHRTFETCCVKWEADTVPGENCWTDRAKFYNECCVAKSSWPPRASFSCSGRGVFWERLRQTVSLFRAFTALNDTPLHKADPKECLLGGVMASLVALVHVTTRNRTLEMKNKDFDRAEYLMKVLFSSPVTLEEILTSGWPLFLTMDFFRWDAGFLDLANQRLPGVMAGERTMRWSNTLSGAIEEAGAGRIPTDVVVKLANSVTKNGEQAGTG